MRQPGRMEERSSLSAANIRSALTGKVLHADAGCIADRVGNRRRNAEQWRLADSLGPIRTGPGRGRNKRRLP